jgi:hypothetical protein
MKALLKLCWLHFIYRMYLCLVRLPKNLYFRKEYAATDSIVEMQCEFLVLLAGGNASIGRDNQWQVRCARQPQKKATVTPLELSVGVSRVDTCWRMALRMSEASKNHAVRSCIQRDKLYCRVCQCDLGKVQVCLVCRHTTAKRFVLILYIR